jgi:hypothetical protein
MHGNSWPKIGQAEVDGLASRRRLVVTPRLSACVCAASLLVKGWQKIGLVPDQKHDHDHKVVEWQIFLNFNVAFSVNEWPAPVLDKLACMQVTQHVVHGTCTLTHPQARIGCTSAPSPLAVCVPNHHPGALLPVILVGLEGTIHVALSMVMRRSRGSLYTASVGMCEGVSGVRVHDCVHVALGQMNSGLEVECAPLSMWVSSVASMNVRASNVTMWPCRVPQAPMAAVGALSNSGSCHMRPTSSIKFAHANSVHRHACSGELGCVVQINVQLSQLPDGSLCGILTGTADAAIATAASTAAFMLVGGW